MLRKVKTEKIVVGVSLDCIPSYPTKFDLEVTNSELRFLLKLAALSKEHHAAYQPTLNVVFNKEEQ